VIETLKAYATAIAGVLAVALGAGLCYVIFARPEIAHLNATIAKMTANDATATANFEAAARKQEQEARDATAKVESDYLAAQKQRDGIIAGLSRDGDSLRQRIAAYAASQRCGLPEAGQPASGPDDAAATLGKLLSSADAMAEQCAAGADQLADQLRALQSFEVKK